LSLAAVTAGGLYWLDRWMQAHQARTATFRLVPVAMLGGVGLLLVSALGNLVGMLSLGRLYLLIYHMPAPSMQGIIKKTLGNCMADGPPPILRHVAAETGRADSWAGDARVPPLGTLRQHTVVASRIYARPWRCDGVNTPADLWSAAVRRQAAGTPHHPSGRGQC
jgi:hypothetical protein